MRRFLSKILRCFFGFIFLMLVAIILTHEFVPSGFQKNLKFKRNGIGFMAARLADLDTTRNVDVLVVGSSHAYRTVDPRIFDIKIFNLGSSSQTPLQTEYLLKRHINDLKPQIVLWEVYEQMLGIDGIEASMDLASNVPKIDKELILFVLKQNEIRVYISLFLNWYENLFDDENIESISGKDKYIPCGYVERIGDEYHNELSDENHEYEKFVFDKKQLAAFERGIKFLRDKGIKVLLFRAPITEAEYNKILNQDEITKYFISIVGTYKLNGYINYNEQSQFIQKAHFYDAHHLNEKGADKVSADLKNIIKKIINKY